MLTQTKYTVGIKNGYIIYFLK